MRGRIQAGVMVALSIVLVFASAAGGETIPVSGWMVHNGTSTVGGTASNPTFTAGDNITLMAPFSDFTLANNGDFLTATTTLHFDDRTANTGVNSLNTQLRFGLFHSTNPTLTAGDAPNLGLIIEYTNEAPPVVTNRRLIRQQTDTAQTSPFTNPTNIGNGVADSGNDSIQGADPGPVTFTLTLTRNGSKLDLSGSITGTDSVSSNPYVGTYSLTGISVSDFTFNRIGLFLGPNVDAPVATLTNSSITTVPEPMSFAPAALAAAGFLTSRRTRRRCTRTRGGLTHA